MSKKRGRPVAACKLCSGPRSSGQRIKIGGKQVPVCEACARRAREFQTNDYRSDKRRGRGRAFRFD